MPTRITDSKIWQTIIDHYYKEGKLRDILLAHSHGVADLALECAANHPELHLDTTLIENGAMLHDIGIIHCNADGIECHGTEPYICHGTIGATMLRKDCELFGMTADEIEPLARICERHTGTGLSKEDIKRQHLPLPTRDLVPETIEEQLVCYADKFYSKTRPEVRKTMERTTKSLGKFGEQCVSKFYEWHEIFG